MSKMLAFAFAIGLGALMHIVYQPSTSNLTERLLNDILSMIAIGVFYYIFTDVFGKGEKP